MTNSRINYLIERFRSREITENEHHELLGLLSDDDNKSAYNDFFRTEWENFLPENRFYTEAHSTEILNKILSSELAPTRLAPWNLQKIIAIAAMVLVVVSFGLYFITDVKKPTSPATTKIKTKIKSDLPPGGNHAVLTLANKTKIVLDNASNGELAHQGNIQIVKASSGELIFKILKTSGNAEAAVVNTISTPRGGQYTVLLPDGTRVWLNAGTSFTFPSYFSDGKRQVSLSGEAYFEVAKNKDMPFIVDAGGSSIEVLGTHFNTKAYPDEKLNKTTLIEGSVKISANGYNKLLQPGQQASSGSPAYGLQVKKANIDEAIAWKNGYFVFADEGLHDIMKRLGRWYNFDTEYQDDVENEIFGGSISKYKSLAEVLKVFQATGTIHFKIINGSQAGTGRRVIVTR